MDERINKLVNSVLQKSTLEECSLSELQQLANRHPYFGAAQLLLAKKLQSVDQSLYKLQVEKTALFFHNPLWLDHLLNDTGDAVEITLEKEIEKIEKVVAEIQAAPEPVLEVVPAPPGPVVETTPAKPEILFEPFHTVDYFASQGIKIRDEELAKDKLGRQLKSFTEWLKTMKRLPVTEIIKQAEQGVEKKVEQLAETSIQERQVVTEAMAEVWEKQGNSEKAIEIYNKLSLLEPGKNAYFAAKIAELKKIT